MNPPGNAELRAHPTRVDPVVAGDRPGRSREVALPHGWYCCVHCDDECRFAYPGWHLSPCDECAPRAKDAP